jgi:hypothetical protein
MMGFPLQLPIAGTVDRAMELTPWTGRIADTESALALVIEVKSAAEAKALSAWIAKIPVAVPTVRSEDART